MAVTDWKFPGTTSNIDTGGTDWSNTDYIKTDDTQYASNLPDKLNMSDYISATNFGFTSTDIPSGATIDGIEFVISRYASSNNKITDQNVLLLNVTTPTNMSSASWWVGAPPADITYGGATNKCCSAVTQANIVSADFGVKLQIAASDASNYTGYVDYIKIRVYYTAGGATVKPHYYYLQQ